MMISQEPATAHAEGFVLGYDRAARRVLQPGRLARAAARVRGISLDRALADGGDPASSPQLAARAALLTSPQSRAEIAASLERLVQAAQGPQKRWWALSRTSGVLANSGELCALACLLRDGGPVYARGVALVKRLVTDGSGPAYRGEADALTREVSVARAALQQ
jgi:hypothetical protein